jgi:MFS family permease
MLGLPLGLGLSSFVSGSIAKHFATDEFGTDGWRYAFFVAGLPGFLLALLCLALPEPARGAAEAHGPETTPPHERAWTALLRIPTLWWIVISGALHNFNMYAIGAFLAPLLTRYYGQNVQEANNIMGVVYCVGGLGILLGGWACDWMVRRRVSGRLEVTTLALAVGSPCVFMAFQQPPGSQSVPAFTAWLLPGCLLFYVYYAAVYSTIQDIVEPALRGKAMALYFFAMYYLGGAGGPYIIGWLSDLRARVAAADQVSTVLSPEAIGLHDALYVVPILGGLLVLVLFAASRTVTRDHQRLMHWSSEASAAQKA